MKTIIIIPTYNERENIKTLINTIKIDYPDFDILVIDDNSPDMTYQVVENLSRKDSRIKLLLRDRKEGLGRALIAGYRYGLNNGYRRLIQLDADLSHPPEYIDSIFEALDSNGLIIASRNITGGGVKDWSLFRIFVSHSANLLTSVMLSLGVKDATSGFRGFSIDFLRYFLKENPISKGFIIQVETTLYAKKCGCGIKEVPFIYNERKNGKSKLDFKETLISTFALIRLFFKRYN